MHRISDQASLKVLLKRARTRMRFIGLPIVRPKVLRELPHDREAHTQGLLVHQGRLYESTGRVGHSSLRVLDPDSGEIERKVVVEGHWLEGIAIVGDCLISLTYTSQTALRFSLPDLALVGEFPYRGEGWGLTSDGLDLLMTNGGSSISRMDADCRTLETVEASYRGRPLSGLNDLAVRGDRILVSMLWDSVLLELSKRTGNPERVVDCAEIVQRSGRASSRDVFNGIAYASESDSFFVTGKHWPRLFEIEIPAPKEQ